ncbi:MAG: hypothetical protein RQ824_12405 [bacterium]|nr:hypothetical protein [bacterium]
MFFGLAVELASPGKFYPHYYEHLLPLLCTVSALFFKDFYGYLETRNKTFAPSLIGLLFLFVFAHLSYPQISYLKLHGDEISLKKYGKFYPEVSEVAEFVKGQTQECETVYEWGGEPGIYYYSKRRAASPINNIFPFIMGPADIRSKRLTRVYKKIMSEPPALFIWNRGDRRSFKLDERFQKLLTDNYKLSKKIGSYYIYEYKNRTKCG